MNEQQNDEVQYQILYVYEVLENTDKLEGHGSYKTIAYVDSEALAHEMAHINPRTPGKVIKKPAILLPDGHYYLLQDTSSVRVDSSMEEAEKANALAKLSPKEREILGL